MKTKTNHKFFFKAMVLVLAFALAVLCAPIDGLVALAQMANYTDYSFMTIGKLEDEIKTTVKKGQTYTITEAYVGGNSNFVVGRTTAPVELAKDDNNDSITLESSSVTVKYATEEVDVAVSTDNANDSVYGTFVADKIGTYSIVYTYEYTANIDGTPKTFTNKYELKVNSELDSASISFESNEANFIPAIIDLAQLTPVVESDVVTGYKDVKGNSKTFTLPKATIKDEDGKEYSADELKYVVSKTAMTEAGKYVLVSVAGGQNAGSVTLDQNATTKEISIPMSVFAEEDFGAGKYTVTYTLYEKTNASQNAHKITSSTKSFTVYADETNDADDYYKGQEYKLDLNLSSSWSDNGQTGVETSLPTATGSMAGEKVDVFYKVKVYHSNTSSTNAWTAISNNQKYADVLDANGYLKDASKFKPLEDGYYTFVYEITDFYGNTTKSELGTYEYTDVKDEQVPTPVIYDASKYVGANATNEKIDEDFKLQSRSIPTAPVVVYAIGIDDNVSTENDDVELTRKIVTQTDTVTKLTITTYNDKNLVFNYTNTGNSDNAYSNFIEHNSVLRKTLGNTPINNDADMLYWLNNNGYKIVVDNANAEKLYDIFNNTADGEPNVFANVTASVEGADAKKAAAISWLKSSASAEVGFAYLENASETFGSTATGGMGSGSYTIRYIAKDVAGNEKEISKNMYIGSYDDTTMPTFKSSTTLAETYLPDSEITFDVPSVSDNYDTNMLTKTFYRYLDNNGNALTIKNDEDETISTENLSEIYADLGTNVDSKDAIALKDKYSKYFRKATSTTADNANGYIELTDESVSKYSINLSEAGENAVKLQIVTYAYDDCGNVGIYAEEVKIANTTDNAPPVFKSIDGEFKTSYLQGEEVVLPSLTVDDDAVSYMGYEVIVSYVAKDGTETKISTYDTNASRDVDSGTYTVNAGKFVASFAGEYKVSIVAKDSTNKTVVAFVELEVEPRMFVEEPKLSASIETKTVELDDAPVVEIPTPVISYEIPDSVIYDNLTDSSTEKYVVRGVDEDGKATNWSTNYGQAYSFKPTEIGNYQIKYSAKLTVYARETFKYVEKEYNASTNSYVGGFYRLADATVGQIYAVSENEFKVIDANNDEYSVILNENNDVVVLDIYGSDATINNNAAFGNVSSASELANWFDDFKLYNLESDAATIVAQDTKGPSLVEYDYETSMSTTELKQNGIKVFGIEANDASGINYTKSKIVVSYKLADGTSGSKSYTNVTNSDGENNVLGGTYKQSSSYENLDGTYKITYTVYDNNNNYSTKEYSIAVGDNVAPTVTMKEDVIADQYTVGTSIEININDITIKDNKTLTNPNKTITLTNTSTDKVITDEGNGDVLLYNLDEVGSYTLTIEVEDAVGNPTTETYEFEVVAKTQDSTMTYKVIGTVLIVVSVLVLAGVIVYFVVSKVKLDKELKK